MADRGDFSRSKILQIQVKAEQMWADSKAVLQPTHIDSVKAIMDNQTARFQELTDSPKQNKVVVTWLEDCNISTTDISDDCKLDGVELASNSKEYEVNLGQQTSYKVDVRNERTNTYTTDEVVARGLMNRLNALDQYWAKLVLAQLKAASGTNKAPSPFTFNATDKTTYIPDAQYNQKVIANLIQQGILNDLNNPYFISDGEFFVDFLNANFDAANADGRGDYNRVQALNLYFDQVNFAKAGIDENLFMIDQSSVGLYTKAWYNSTPEFYGGDVQKTMYSVPSLNLPGVRYDVEYTMTCEKKAGVPHYYHVFSIVTRGLFAVNPVACNDTNTGVLSYKKGVDPALPGE